MNEQTVFSISGLRFGLNTESPVAVPESFRPFLSEAPADVQISFREVPSISLPEGVQVFRDEDIAVFDCGGRFVRLCHQHGGDRDAELTRIFAAASYDWDTGLGQVQYSDLRRSAFSDSKGCFAHMGFEDILMSRGRLALHASLIRTDRGGILFSGVSGIGKSTQADLWHRYEGSPILNGDRPILRKTDHGWEACGSPFAGSSRYYVNESVPIRAVVLLEQGPTCRLRRLGPAEAFCGLYAGTTVNIWNNRYVLRACDLLEDLIRQVPVYRYCCTPDEQAVRTLKAELAKGGE